MRQEIKEMLNQCDDSADLAKHLFITVLNNLDYCGVKIGNRIYVVDDLECDTAGTYKRWVRVYDICYNQLDTFDLGKGDVLEAISYISNMKNRKIQYCILMLNNDREWEVINPLKISV